MTTAKLVQRQLGAVTTARTESAEFVRMDGRFAVVNIGDTTVTIPCQGFNPPLAGMPVSVQWVNGSPAVTGPVTPLSPLGVVTAAGTPRATVTVGGVSYMMPVMASYTPVNGDTVIVDWTIPGGMIMGKVAAVDQPTTPGETGGGGGARFTVTVRASNSGRYDRQWSNWWGNAPWASNSNDGIWVYGNRVRDAVGSASLSRVEIYLPLESQRGNASIGVHPYPSIPSHAPSISSLSSLPRRSGWVTLPTSFATYLAVGGRGVGVTAPGGGYNVWRGTSEDSLSGALRITGTR